MLPIYVANSVLCCVRFFVSLHNDSEILAIVAFCGLLFIVVGHLCSVVCGLIRLLAFILFVFFLKIYFELTSEFLFPFLERPCIIIYG